MSDAAARTPSEAGEGAGEPRAGTRERDSVEFARVVAFTDGVFAIAMTLLVLGIDVPPGVEDVGRAIGDEWKDFFAYAISFAVLGRLWISHHQMVGRITRFDPPMMAINLLYLAFVALLPFTSQVLGDFGDDPAAVVLYAASIVAVMATYAWQMVHAYRHGLVAPEMRADARAAGPGVFAALVVFAVSMPLALVSTTVAELIWLAAAPFGDPLGRPLARWAMDR